MASDTAIIGGNSGVSIFTVMSNTKMTVAGVAAVILAVTAAVYQSICRYDSEASLSASVQQARTTAMELASSNRRIADLRHEKAELEAKLIEQSQKVAKLSGAPQEVSPASAEVTYPRWQRAVNKMKAKFALQSYFLQKGIPVKDVDLVLSFMEEPDRITADASELAEMERRKGNWSPANDAKLAETTRDAREDAHQKLLSLVGGEEGWNSLREYLVGSFRDQGIVNRVAAAVYATDTPLNGASGQALAQVIHQNRYSPGDTVGGAQVDPNDLNLASPILAQFGLGTLPLVSDAALAAAAKVLSPEQLAALRQLQEQQLAGLRIAKESRP